MTHNPLNQNVFKNLVRLSFVKTSQTEFFSCLATSNFHEWNLNKDTSLSMCKYRLSKLECWQHSFPSFLRNYSWNFHTRPPLHWDLVPRLSSTRRQSLGTGLKESYKMQRVFMSLPPSLHVRLQEVSISGGSTLEQMIWLKRTEGRDSREKRRCKQSM